MRERLKSKYWPSENPENQHFWPRSKRTAGKAVWVVLIRDYTFLFDHLLDRHEFCCPSTVLNAYMIYHEGGTQGFPRHEVSDKQEVLFEDVSPSTAFSIRQHI